GGCTRSLAAVVLCAAALVSAVVRAAEVDPFMGDWQGQWEVTDGYNSGSIAAYVIALGGDQYQVKLVEVFGVTTAPYAVLETQAKDGKLEFAGSLNPGSSPIEGTVNATIENGKFTGRFQGQTGGGESIKGTFSLEKTARQSPTLGAKPPAGAIVLFDGTNFDKWVRFGYSKGVINIIDAIGNAQDAVAYLRAKIWSAQARKATLQLGTDDGVKVWLNGKPIHANNAARGVVVDQDKVEVSLQQGINELLLKVTNGGGDWGAIVRFAGEGGPLPNLNEVSPQFASEKGSNEYLRQNDGFITQWQVAGPYQEAGKGAEALFDVEFAPEKASASDVKWKWINAHDAGGDKVKWSLVDGAMEVKAGAGNIVTKDRFKDFKLHIEFRSPFMPAARGQGRGNSGVYLQGRYEIQVLDSYGLEGRDNECGGIYQVGAPMVNMCLPPMQWQTYDITFQAPRFDASGSKTEDAIVTVVHNGVTIHDRRKLSGPTGGAMDDRISEPGGIYLQDHGNLVQFRNIWLVETK
ncbi:MAG: DUF1080 domain-containing protein, partial [Solirubrobacterales bacterium]